jgi:hypothetical protein
MSVPIQTTPAPAQGAQEPLSVDSKKSTHGFDTANQNSLSFCRGTEVPASSGSVSPYGVAGREQERAKPVDANHLEGSNKGDHRAHPGDTAAASLAAASGSTKGPRDAVGQAHSSKYLS